MQGLSPLAPNVPRAYYYYSRSNESLSNGKRGIVRFRAEREDLADALGRASRAVSTRSPLDILQGVLCEVEGSRLKVTGTDLEFTVRTTLEVEVMEGGRTVVPARLAAEAVRKLPAGAVTMGAEEGVVTIRGSGPEFALRELSVEDFPAVGVEEEMDGAAMDGDTLVSAVNQVGVAASGDEARPILTGIFFEEEAGSLRLVATDSYRLAVRDVPGVVPQNGLVPVRALRELGRTVGAPKVTGAIGERTASFASERGTMWVRLIEGTFPNYRQLLPEAYSGRLLVGKEALLEAVGRAALVAEDHIPLRLALVSEGVDLSVQRQEVGGESEHVDGTYEGEDMTIAFNPRYLADGVSMVEDQEVVLDVVDPLKPGLIRGAETETFRYLLMPVRL